jgi:hypothetical protein
VCWFCQLYEFFLVGDQDSFAFGIVQSFSFWGLFSKNGPIPFLLTNFVNFAAMILLPFQKKYVKQMFTQMRKVRSLLEEIRL